MIYRENLKFGKKDEIIIKLFNLTEIKDIQKKETNLLIQLKKKPTWIRSKIEISN